MPHNMKKIPPSFFDYNRGLFHGKRPSYFEKRSEYKNAHTHILLPNIHDVPLYSELLNRRILFRTTTHVLRIIDKKGGLDNYLLTTPPRELDSEVALKWRAFLLHFREAKQQAVLQADFLAKQSLPPAEAFQAAGLPHGPTSSALFPGTAALTETVLHQLAAYKAIRPYGFLRIQNMKKYKPFREYLHRWNMVSL
jgi:large subunit ribosomal protein L28